jgi:hypothetical protein
MQAPALFSIALLCACGSSVRPANAGPAVHLNVEPSSVSAGDSVVLTLRNELADAIGCNLCTSELQRRDGDEWHAVPSDRVCTMELRTLAPETEDRYALELPGKLAPGAYRYSAAVHIPSTAMASNVQSDPFQVRP